MKRIGTSLLLKMLHSREVSINFSTVEETNKGNNIALYNQTDPVISDSAPIVITTAF